MGELPQRYAIRQRRRRTGFIEKMPLSNFIPCSSFKTEQRNFSEGTRCLPLGQNRMCNPCRRMFAMGIPAERDTQTCRRASSDQIRHYGVTAIRFPELLKNARAERGNSRTMRSSRTTYMLMTVGFLLCAPGWTVAQNAITTPAQKTIGQSKVEIVPSLIVMNARGASLQGQTLTLTGVSPNSIVFSDRPVRAAGHTLTSTVLDEWAQGDSFGKDPPNATVSVLSKDGASVRDVVVVLKSPKMDGDKLTFDVQVIEGDLAGADGPASVFIAALDFGRLLTPQSTAVPHRTAHRAAWYLRAARAVESAYDRFEVGVDTAYGACGTPPYPPCRW